jgi:hypothetical protein
MWQRSPPPMFSVRAGIPVDLRLSFDGDATFSVGLSAWNGTRWVQREPPVEDRGLSQGRTVQTYNLDAMDGGSTLLLTMPVNMTSPAGGTPIKTTAELVQNGTSRGTLVTPPTSPGPGQSAYITMLAYLVGV